MWFYFYQHWRKNYLKNSLIFIQTNENKNLITDEKCQVTDKRTNAWVLLCSLSCLISSLGGWRQFHREIYNLSTNLKVNEWRSIYKITRRRQGEVKKNKMVLNFCFFFKFAWSSNLCLWLWFSIVVTGEWWQRQDKWKQKRFYFVNFYTYATEIHKKISYIYEDRKILSNVNLLLW